MPVDTATKPFKLMIDNQSYDWPQATITAEEIRQLASLPASDTVDLFHKVPGKGDVQVVPGQTVDLSTNHGVDHFSSMAVGSRAGA